MRERFIAAKEFNDLNITSLVLVDHFERRQALFHGEVDMDDVYFQSQRGAPAQFVRSCRLGHEEVATPHTVREPSPTNLALLQLCRARYNTCEQRLRRGGHEGTLYKPPKALEPDEDAPAY